MNNTLVQIQLFYEIASIIGNSPYLEEMAKESLSAYLHKLNCSTGIILRRTLDDTGITRFEPVVTMPRRANESDALKASLAYVPERLDFEACKEFLQTLPLSFEVDGGKHGYVMRLQGFGLLLLIKAGDPFEESFVRSLTRLNKKLADACLVCVHSEEITKINQALTQEIRVRLRAEGDLKRVLDELESRVQERTQDLLAANRQLEEALANVKTLSGLIPICSVCKKIRDDRGYWKQLESYISSHSDAMFTHGICPGCVKKVYPDFQIPDELAES